MQRGRAGGGEGPKGKGSAGKGAGQLNRRTAVGKGICVKHARDGKGQTACPQNRAHVCEKCLMGGHKTSECTA